MANRPPTDTVTFLFTDIEGSTRLWERFPSAMRGAVERQSEIVRKAIHENDGFAFYSGGDSVGAAFGSPSDALEAAIDAQEKVTAEDWGEVGPILVRMGLDTGLVEYRDGDYLGPPVNRVARVMDEAGGGQILMTSTTADLLRHRLPDDTALSDRGRVRLKGMQDPVLLYEVTAGQQPARRRWGLIVAAAAVTGVLAAVVIGISLINGESPTPEAQTTIAQSTTATAGDSESVTPILGSAWHAVLEGRPAEPIVSNGVVYVGTDGGSDSRLYAIDLQTGEVGWEYETDGPIEDAPLLVDGVVYATSRRGGGMVGVDADSGELTAICFPTDIELASLGPLIEHQAHLYVWALAWILSWPGDDTSVDQCIYEPSAPPISAITAGPSAAGEGVFVGAGRDVHRFSAESMAQEWRTFTAEGELTTYCGNHDWIDAVELSIAREGSIDTELLVFARDWEGRLYRIQGQSGQLTDTLDIGPDYSANCPGPANTTRPVRGRPVLTEEALYAPTFDDRIAALDLDSLGELWSVSVGSIMVGPILDGSILYLVTETGQIRAIDTRRRAEAWSLETGLAPTGIAASGDTIVLTGEFGVVAFPAP